MPGYQVILRCRISGIDQYIKSQQQCKQPGEAGANLDNTSLNCLDLLTPPISQDGSDRTGSALSDDPNKILVTIIPSLVLRPGRDECKVSRPKLVMSQFAPKALLYDKCAGTGDYIDDGVLTALSETRTNQPRRQLGSEGMRRSESERDVSPTLLAVVMYGACRMWVCCENCPRERKRVTTQFWARFFPRAKEKTHPKHTFCHTYRQWQFRGWGVLHCPKWA